jgi:hypothetical protein
MQPSKLPRGILLISILGWLVAGVILGVAIGSWRSANAAGPPSVQVAPRQYYLTQNDTYDGISADQACATGYHMASIFEILDPSNLQYNTSLGYTQGDSGAGPPHEVDGWIRSGDQNDLDLNCAGWTTAGAGAYGPIATLSYDLVAGAESPWTVTTGRICSETRRVWCMQN